MSKIVFFFFIVSSTVYVNNYYIRFCVRTKSVVKLVNLWNLRWRGTPYSVITIIFDGANASAKGSRQSLLAFANSPRIRVTLLWNKMSDFRLASPRYAIIYDFFRFRPPNVCILYACYAHWLLFEIGYNNIYTVIHIVSYNNNNDNVFGEQKPLHKWVYIILFYTL